MAVKWCIEKTIDIGYEFENNSRQHTFNIAEERKKWPTASPRIIVQRPGSTEAVPGVCSVDEDTITWIVTKDDTRVKGKGRLWVAFLDGDNLLGYALSAIIHVHDGPNMAEEPDDESSPLWLQQVLDAAIRAEESAKKAEEALNNSSIELIHGGDVNGTD